MPASVLQSFNGKDLAETVYQTHEDCLAALRSTIELHLLPNMGVTVLLSLDTLILNLLGACFLSA